MRKGFFVTGTDTEVGKTVIAAALVRAGVRAGLRSAGMKPVASGCIRGESELYSEDACALVASSNVELDMNLVNPYRFEPPIAPHLAAADVHVDISVEAIIGAANAISRQCDFLVVEGVGGWKVPLTNGLDVAGLARRMGFPVVLVVGLRLGCINHALLTAEAIASSGCTLAGWIANAVEPRMVRQRSNIETLAGMLRAPCWGVVPPLPDTSLAVDYLKVDGDF